MAPTFFPRLIRYQKISDEELMQSYMQGDHAAFHELVGRHQTGVYNFLARHLGQSENTDEAFQEVFVRVIKSALTYTPQAKFSTWLYTIARNYCVDLSRKARFRRTTSLNGESGNEGNVIRLEEKITDGQAGPENYAEARRLSEMLEGALQQINPDQKEVFLLRESAGLPFEEIAQVVGSSVNTVKSRMRYALEALRESMRKMGVTDL